MVNTLNRDSLVQHIKEKISAYEKRRDVAKSEGKHQESGDYELRMMPLNNLLIRIIRGDFDHRTVKKEPEMEQGVPNIIESDWDLTDDQKDEVKDDEN